MNDLYCCRRGLAAARDIKKGELILRVPKGVLMTSQRLMRNDESLSIAVKKHASLCCTQVILLCSPFYCKNENLGFAIYGLNQKVFFFLEFSMCSTSNVKLTQTYC